MRYQLGQNKLDIDPSLVTQLFKKVRKIQALAIGFFFDSGKRLN